MGAESEINATTNYVQAKFYLHKNFGTVDRCSHVHMMITKLYRKLG